MLLPYAQRLRSEGTRADVLVWRERYERAWGGKLQSVGRDQAGKLNTETLKAISDELLKPDWILLTDMYEDQLTLRASRANFYKLREPEEPSTNLRLGAWFFRGEPLHSHFLIYDQGLWPSGLGPELPGGITLILLEPEMEAVASELWSTLEAPLENFSGLVEADMRTSGENWELALGDWSAGWPWLQTPAFLSELENFTEVLLGGEPRFTEGVKYVAALPVSIPPFPAQQPPASEVPIELNQKLLGKFFWHDVRMDNDEKKLYSAGLDGLLGVCRGAARNLDLARRLAVSYAELLRVPGKQYRPDVGSSVAQILSQLELQYGVTL